MKREAAFLVGLAVLSLSGVTEAPAQTRARAAQHRILGVGVEPIDTASLPPKGPVMDYGVRVVLVQAGSTAATSGISVGDILLSLDGEPIVKKGDIQRIISSRAAGAIVSVHLVRNGVALDIATQL